MEVEANDGSAADEELAALERKRLSGRRLVILGLPAAFGVTLLLVGALMVFGGGNGDAKAENAGPEEGGHSAAEAAADAAKKAEQEKPAKPSGPVFCEADDFLVNLNTGGRRATYLKLQVQFEVGAPTGCERLDAAMPVVKNNFQSFLRELRPEELSGSAGNYRLKEELLVRVNRAVEPGTVRDVHITEFLVQ